MRRPIWLYEKMPKDKIYVTVESNLGGIYRLISDPHYLGTWSKGKAWGSGEFEERHYVMRGFHLTEYIVDDRVYRGSASR